MAKVITRFDGIPELLETVRDLPKQIRGPILSSAMRGAGDPVVKAAKAKAPRQTGALAKSIIAIPKTRKSTKEPYVIIGPRNEYFVDGKRVKKNGSKDGASNPGKYGHLVEYGHAIKNAQGGATHVAAKPFMRPALISAQGEVLNSMAEGISSGIARSKVKLAKKLAKAAT